jgi:zinc protease
MNSVIERGVVDGVTTLCSSGVAGRHLAALTFRVGRFDETLPTAGITHIVEHLTLSGHEEAGYKFNASVSGRHTTFYLETGSSADISTFMTAVCSGLSADHSALLDRERRILRTEAASRGGAGALGACLAERYGARGPGLVNYREFAFQRAGWDELADWRERWFTAGNAVLWVAGDFPDGLRLSLPAGPAVLTEAVTPLDLTLPGYVAVQARSGIGLSLLSDRSHAQDATAYILQQRLTQVLRHEHGLSYDVQLVREDVGRDDVHLWVAADALPEQTPMAAHMLMTTFEALVDGGCGTGELESYQRLCQERAQQPGASVAMLQRQARALMDGRSPTSAEETSRLVAGVTIKDVGAAARALQASMIVASPGLVPAVQGRMGALPRWSQATVSGTEHQPVAPDLALTLTTSADGVMLTDKAGNQVTVRYAAVAALVRWNDGKLSLIGDDGFIIMLDAAEWRDGASIVAGILPHVSGDLVVAVDEPGPQRPTVGAQGTATAQSEAGGRSKPARVADGERKRRVRSSILVRYARQGRLRWILAIVLGVVLVLIKLTIGYLWIVLGVFGLAAYEIQRYRASRRH